MNNVDALDICRIHGVVNIECDVVIVCELAVCPVLYGALLVWLLAAFSLTFEMCFHLQ